MKSLLTLAMLGVAAPAVAQTQADMNQSALNEWGAADAALNAQYRATMTAMRRIDRDTPPSDQRPGYAATLLRSQRAWLAYRDADCVVEGYGMRGGSAEGAERNFCMTRVTRARTVWLKAQTR